MNLRIVILEIYSYENKLNTIIMENLIQNISPYVMPGLKGKVKIEFKTFEERVLESFCAINLCTLEQIKSKRRFRKLVAIRQSFSLWARENTKLSLEEIGNIICNGHVTIMHSIKTANDRIDVNDAFFTDVNKKCLSTIN